MMSFRAVLVSDEEIQDLVCKQFRVNLSHTYFFYWVYEVPRPQLFHASFRDLTHTKTSFLY